MTTPKPASAGLSFADLNLSTRHDVPFSMTYRDENGNPTEFVVKVIGQHSEIVQAWQNAAMNAARKADAVAKVEAAKRGEEAAEFRPIEEDIKVGIEGAAIRIVGWEGVRDFPFTPENAQLLCRSNALLVKQVIDASNGLANFTKVSPQT